MAYYSKASCARLLAAVLFLLPALGATVATQPLTFDGVSTALKELGWKVSVTEGPNSATATKSVNVGGGKARTKLAVDFSVADIDGEPTLAFQAHDTSSKTIFQNDIGAMKAADAGRNVGAGGRRLLVTCPASCPTYTCQYRERVVYNIGCMNLKYFQNPGFGYQVRYRRGRNAYTNARYGCNSPSWYSDYLGRIASCPACQNSTWTMLDCSWPN